MLPVPPPSPSTPLRQGNLGLNIRGSESPTALDVPEFVAPPTKFAPRALCLVLAVLALSACKGGAKKEGQPEGIVSLSAATEKEADPATLAKEGGPRMGAILMAAPIYSKPDRRSPKLGYLRAGGTVVRGEKPAAYDDCQGGYYRVLPAGFICNGEEASIDMKHPIIRALTKRPDLSKPMPYPYAFVRAIAPNYYRPATKAEQFQYEMRLKEHLRSYKRLQKKWDAIEVGANDVPLDPQGNAIGEPPTEAPDLSDQVLYNGDGND
ncbi:MAG TPA: hypothetical protein PKA58_29410, partial [Polyangium sp.]|nr:hypothetical protein [Polyangium sp.]